MTKAHLVKELKNTFTQTSQMSIDSLDDLMCKLGAISYFSVWNKEILRYTDTPAWFFPEFALWIELGKENIDCNTVRILSVHEVKEE